MNRATSDVPVALRMNEPFDIKEDSSHSQRQDRFTSHSVNRTRLPRPGAPSSFVVTALARGGLSQ
jgi:hypothetical protein